MARFVHEIMNSELFALTPSHSCEEALANIVSLGITGAPVLDSGGHPLGLVSLRDLSGRPNGQTVSTCMSSPAVVIHGQATVTEAALLMGRTGLHRLVVVDEEDKAVGVVSNIDVIRGLMGMAASHPQSFPHYDEQTGQVWSDPADLTLDAVLAQAPDAPGVFALLHDPPGAPTTVVWAEAADDLSARLLDLVSAPQATDVDRVLAYRNLRFRLASIPDPQHRRAALERLREGMRAGAAPHVNA